MSRQALITHFFTAVNPADYRLTPYTNAPAQKREIAECRRRLGPDNYDRMVQWHGYLFTATNSCSDYCVYTAITRGLSNGFALPPGTLVAQANLDDEGALTHISVHECCRRQGIGAELIRLINKACPRFKVYRGIENNSRYRLSGEGAFLITACVNRGILKPEQVISGVPTSPPFSALSL